MDELPPSYDSVVGNHSTDSDTDLAEYLSDLQSRQRIPTKLPGPPIKRRNRPPILKNSKMTELTFDRLRKFIHRNKKNNLKILLHVLTIINTKIEIFTKQNPIDFSRTRNRRYKQIMLTIHKGLTALYNDPQSTISFVLLPPTKQVEYIDTALYILAVLCDYNRPDYTVDIYQ